MLPELKRQLLGRCEELGLRPYEDTPRRTAASNGGGGPPDRPEPSARSVGKASGPPLVPVTDVRFNDRHPMALRFLEAAAPPLHAQGQRAEDSARTRPSTQGVLVSFSFIIRHRLASLDLQELH
ncbi:hypothetical protein HPB47_022753 [Ixodes persulcatus]|uniref:Uncharacterized protein n=1 Tax=Ixodes persulcatus TaxID=34615 RepID=A0AC60QC28_IXOPE|nr:hypothetical protein HPB47_022753 [Ixodes persulcatus]